MTKCPDTLDLRAHQGGTPVYRKPRNGPIVFGESPIRSFDGGPRPLMNSLSSLADVVPAGPAGEDLN